MKRLLPVILIFTLALIFFSLIPKALPSPKPASPLPAPQSSGTPHSAIFYPITNYASRLSLRHFGQHLSPRDVGSVPCGEAFTGFHTGDDLEISPDEKDEDVPVYSVSKGTVTSVDSVSGYGGLIIISSELAGQPVTLYYGHVSLGSVIPAKGASVSPGEKLALLGAGCTRETSNERKHLHFGIHKGQTIDLRGYVQNQSDLTDWLNPEETLRSVSAISP